MCGFCQPWEIFYHPDDNRYSKYNGKKAKVPLFDFEVPIMSDERVDPEKGTETEIIFSNNEESHVPFLSKQPPYTNIF